VLVVLVVVSVIAPEPPVPLLDALLQAPTIPNELARATDTAQRWRGMKHFLCMVSAVKANPAFVSGP